MTEGLNLIDTSKYKFGSVEWQEAMINNIIEKQDHHEELSGFEKIFIEVQKEHNESLIKKT